MNSYILLSSFVLLFLVSPFCLLPILLVPLFFTLFFVLDDDGSEPLALRESVRTSVREGGQTTPCIQRTPLFSSFRSAIDVRPLEEACRRWKDAFERVKAGAVSAHHLGKQCKPDLALREYTEQFKQVIGTALQVVATARCTLADLEAELRALDSGNVASKLYLIASPYSPVSPSIACEWLERPMPYCLNWVIGDELAWVQLERCRLGCSNDAVNLQRLAHHTGIMIVKSDRPSSPPTPSTCAGQPILKSKTN